MVSAHTRVNVLPGKRRGIGRVLKLQIKVVKLFVSFCFCLNKRNGHLSIDQFQIEQKNNVRACVLYHLLCYLRMSNRFLFDIIMQYNNYLVIFRNYNQFLCDSEAFFNKNAI